VRAALEVARLLLVLVWAVAPGMALAAWTLPRDASRIARLATAIALGPPLAGALVAILLLLGHSPKAATLDVVVLSAVALTMAWRMRRPAAAESPGARTALTIALAFAFVTLLFPLAWSWWRVYSDNWTHAGIVRAVESAVPPLDPGFAGAKLQYAWIYHAFVAGAHRATGADVFTIMVLLAALALVGTLLGAASALARARASDILWTLLLLGLGLNALFPLFVPLIAVRAFTGEVRGFAELARQFDLAPLQWDTTGVFLRSLSGQDFFLDKFMVATPFALSLAALSCWCASFLRWLAAGRRGEMVLGALLTLAAGLMHPVTGVFLGASCGLAAVLALAFARDEPPLRTRVLSWTLAVWTGLVPVVLYTKTVIGGAGGTHSELPFDLAPLKLVGYATCLALGLVFAARPLARAWREHGPERTWTFWVIAGLVVAAVSRLPGPSPFFTVDKLSYLVWIPLVLTAGPSFAAWMRSRGRFARIAIALLLFAPVNGLALASRALDPHNLAEMPFELPGFAWLRTQAPGDAVLLVQEGDWESSGFGERDQYYSLGHPAAQLGYDQKEIAARAALTQRLFTTGGLSGEDRARLAALHRPVFAVWVDFKEPMWRWTPGTMARALAPAGPKPSFDPGLPIVFASPELEVRRVPLSPTP